MSAASAIKRSDPSIEVVVLKKGNLWPIMACSLPYYIANVMPDHRQLIDLTPERARQDYQIEVLTRHEVMAISAAKNLVMVFLTAKPAKKKHFSMTG